jgi:D-3-phosphoglycerate dehydrogenase
MANKNIVIILAKEESPTFNRYLIPVLGRSVVTYPIMAARYCRSVDKIYLLTDSKSVIEHVKNFEHISILLRGHSGQRLIDEIRNSIQSEIDRKIFLPSNIIILFANSPCIHAELLDNALKLLDEKPEIDTVASVMRRSEFEPSKSFSLKNDGSLNRASSVFTTDPNVFFLDKRFIVVRWDVLQKNKEQSDLVEGLLGDNIHPLIQSEGIWDIDYPWQIPAVERWLRQNGFTDEKTPYDNTEKIVISSPRKTIHDGQSTKLLIGTVPFGDIDRTPLALLDGMPEISYLINPLGRKFKEEELAEYIKEFDILIAGTERISKKVLANAHRLKLISRVGIGLDNVDLNEAKRLGIKVSYTPEAPAPAVAELAVAHMLNLLRKLPIIDRKMRSGVWQRYSGERLANQVVGIIGTGRIGKRVIRHLQGFHPKAILVNDLKPDHDFYKLYNAVHVEKEQIYAESDIITLHVPLTPQTKDLITLQQMKLMKKSCVLINTSRGGIISEKDIYSALNDKIIGGAAIDVFEEEPYAGKLIEVENCLISCHMGSMTNDCRSAMEILATEEAVRFVRNQPLIRSVPHEEYIYAS